MTVVLFLARNSHTRQIRVGRCIDNGRNQFPDFTFQFFFFCHMFYWKLYNMSM